MDDAQLAAAFERATKRKRRIRFAALALVIASPFGYLGWLRHRSAERADERGERNRAAVEANKLTPADLPDARRAAADAKRVLDQAAAAWAEVTPAMLRDRTVLLAENCPLTFESPPPREQIGQLVKLDSWGGTPGLSWPYQLVEPGAATLAPSPALDQAGARIAALLKSIEGGTGTKTDVAELSGLARRHGQVVVVVADEHVVPRVLGDKEFSPGLIAGTAYVYVHHLARVVCAGPIRVESSSFVAADWETSSKLAAKGKDMLGIDLDLEVRRKIAHYLKAAR